MAGPWENYNSTAAETPEGPWAKYASTTPPGKSIGQQIADIPKGFWEDMTKAGQGIVNLFSSNPVKSVQGIGQAQAQPLTEAVDAWKKGNHVEALRHFVNYMIPFAGPSLDVQGNQAQSGEVGKSIGGTLSTAGQFVGPPVIDAAVPAIAGAAETAAKLPGATAAAVKAAAPDVAAGTTKAAIGAAASEVLPGPMRWPARVMAVYPGARQIKAGVAAGREAFNAALSDKIAAATESLAPAEDMELLNGLAKGQGLSSFEKATPEQQAAIRDVAARINTPQQALQAAPAPAAPRPPEYYGVQPAAPPVVQQPGPIAPTAGMTVQDMIQAELAARKAALPPEPEPPQPLQGGNAPQPIQPRGAPVRPPLAAATPNSAPPGVPLNAPTMSTAQAEAAMARKAPAATEPPTSMYTAAGEKKSPELRAAEITGANVTAKADRFIQALHDAGVTSAEARQIPVGRLSMAQIEQGGVPGWGNITDDLVAKGILKPGENPPNRSIAGIIDGLKKLEAAKTGPLAKNPKAMEIAQQLQSEMEKPETAPQEATQTPVSPVEAPVEQKTGEFDPSNPRDKIATRRELMDRGIQFAGPYDLSRESGKFVVTNEGKLRRSEAGYPVAAERTPEGNWVPRAGAHTQIDQSSLDAMQQEIEAKYQSAFGAKAAEPELIAPKVPDPPRPLQKAYGPNWQKRPDAVELQKQYNQAVYARQKALKQYKAYVEESNRRFAAKQGTQNAQ